MHHVATQSCKTKSSARRSPHNRQCTKKTTGEKKTKEETPTAVYILGTWYTFRDTPVDHLKDCARSLFPTFICSHTGTAPVSRAQPKACGSCCGSHLYSDDALVAHALHSRRDQFADLDLAAAHASRQKTATHTPDKSTNRHGKE